MAQQIQQLINELEATRWLFLPDWNKRILAARRLGEQRAAQAVPKLSAVIKTENQNPDLCRAAFVALGQIGGTEAVSVLGAYLAHSTWHPIAVDGLAQIGDAPAISGLIESYPQANSEQANRIEQALAQLSPADTVTPLISALAHSAADVRALATRLLSSPAFTEPLITALGSNQAPIREQAGTWLVRQGQEVMPNLILALAHPDEGIGSGASDCLAQLGQPAIPRLIEELPKNNTRAVNAASAALIKIGEPAIEPLIAILSNLNQAASAVAAQVLLNIGSPAVKPLMMALDTHPQAREVLLNMEEAVRSTFKEASADEVPWLIGLLRTAPSDNELQALLSTALREIGGAAVPELLKLLASDDEQEKQMGYNALKSIRGYLGRDVSPILLQEFINQEPTIQETIIEMMCEIANVKDHFDVRPFAEGGRFRLALHLYRQQLPFILPYSLTELHIAGLRGEDFSYQKQSCMEDIKNELEIGKEKSYWSRNNDGSPIEPLESSQAIPQLQAIALIAPEFALPHYWIGQWYYFRLEDYEKAIQAFERATECSKYVYKKNREAKSYWWLGVSYGTPSPYFDYEKSQACFQQAKDLGWDDRLLYRGIFSTSQAAMDHCIETGENPTLYLTAMRQMTSAFSRTVSAQGREQANVKQTLNALQSQLEQTEEMYARFGEAEGFAKVRRQFLIERTRKLSMNAQDDEAIALLRQLREEYPDDLEVRQHLGGVLIATGQVPEGLKQYKELVSQAPEMRDDILQVIFNLGPIMMQKVDGLIKSRHYADALGLVDEWKELMRLITGYSGSAVSDLAIAMTTAICICYLRVAKASDNLAAYESAMGTALVASSFVTKSRTTHSAEVVSEVMDCLKMAYTALGDYFKSRHQWRKAIEHYQSAVKMDAKADHAWLGLSQSFAKIGDTENGIACLIKAAELGNELALMTMKELMTQ